MTSLTKQNRSTGLQTGDLEVSIKEQARQLLMEAVESHLSFPAANCHLAAG